MKKSGKETKSMLAFGLMLAFILVYFLIYLRQVKRRKQENSLSAIEQFHNNYRKHTQGNQEKNVSQSNQANLQPTDYNMNQPPSNNMINSGFPQTPTTHYKRKSQPQRDTYTKYVTKYNSTEDYREK